MRLDPKHCAAVYAQGSTAPVKADSACFDVFGVEAVGSELVRQTLSAAQICRQKTLLKTIIKKEKIMQDEIIDSQVDQLLGGEKSVCVDNIVHEAISRRQGHQLFAGLGKRRGYNMSSKRRPAACKKSNEVMLWVQIFLESKKELWHNDVD